MAICAYALQQTDGSYLLALDPSNTNPSTCAYVVETGTESVLGSLASMTVDDALVIAASIALVWAGAWGIRQVAQYLKGTENETD